MRTTLTMATALAALALTAAGCRCGSEMPAPDPQTRTTVDSPPPVADGPMVWCMACAKAGFTACKRVEGRDGEQNVKRRAQLEACKDVGILEEQCNDQVLSNVKCGSVP